MPDMEKVIEDLTDIGGWIAGRVGFERARNFLHTIDEAVALLKEQEKEIKALRLLVEWATDCDFGFDQFPEEYERYKDEITDMKYIEGMIHVAKRTLEDHGAFEKGR